MQATTADRAVGFIGVPLPAEAQAVRAAGEAGMDQLVLLSFEAGDADARAYARQLLGRDPAPGQDPGLAYLGDDLPWWPRTPPPRAEGGEVRRDDNRVVKLLLAPTPGGPTRVFVAAFSQ